MSNYDYEDDDFDTPSNDGNDLVKQLRKANKQKEKELTELKRKDYYRQIEYTKESNRIVEIKEALTLVGSRIPGDWTPYSETEEEDDYE